MADDNGIIADLEASLVTELSSIQISGEDVFRTVEHWEYQVTSPDAFKRHEPFAFVTYERDRRVAWEGDHDMHGRYFFLIFIGIEHGKKKSGARIGSGTGSRELGISRVRDLVISELQNLRTSTTDDNNERWEYENTDIVWNEPYRTGIMMRFSVDHTSDYN